MQSQITYFPSFILIGQRDPRNISQFRPKIPVQLGVMWFPSSLEIYIYSAYQLHYWQVGGITQFELTCFSVCSIQCHNALEEERYCLVEWRCSCLYPHLPLSLSLCSQSNSMCAHLAACLCITQPLRPCTVHRNNNSIGECSHWIQKYSVLYSRLTDHSDNAGGFYEGKDIF